MTNQTSPSPTPITGDCVEILPLHYCATPLHEYSADQLREALKQTIFRGRKQTALAKQASQSFHLSDQITAGDESPASAAHTSDDTLSAIQEKYSDIKWQKICLTLDDKRDPTQCTLNLYLAKSCTAPTTARLPTLCILHGTGKSFDTEEVLTNAVRFVHSGFLVVLLNSRYHGCRRAPCHSGKQRYLEALIDAWKHNAPEHPHCNLYPFIYDTAADLSAVAHYLLTRPDVNPPHLGITGISLGGMHAWFAAAIDTRWTAVAPLIGVQSFKYAVDEACFEARVATIQDLFDTAAKDLGLHQVTCDVVRAVWHRVCPGLLDLFDGGKSLALLSPRPVFIANGELDPRCPVRGVEAAVEVARGVYETECGEPQRMELRVYEAVGHEVTGEMWDDCRRFFGRVFQVGEMRNTGKQCEAAQEVGDVRLRRVVRDGLDNQWGV